MAHLSRLSQVAVGFRGRLLAYCAGVTLHRPVEAYSARAQEYAQVLGSMEATTAADRELVSRWAGSVAGEIVDVGCGPGHWTAFLHERGCQVRGVDPVAAFVDIARRSHPQVSYDIGSFDDLAPGSAAGVLAWYSLIHLDPEVVPDALARCRSALVPGGSLLMGFFQGERLAPFDHAVTTAYAWPVPEFTGVLEQLGFTVLMTERRHDPGSRAHASIVATAP